MKGPYAIWGCRRGYVQIGSAVDRHEQRVVQQKVEMRDALMRAARSMRWTARANSLREVGEALMRLAVAMRMTPPPNRFVDWRDNWSWI